MSIQLIYFISSPNILHPNVLKLLVNMILEPLSMTFGDSWRMGMMSEVWRKPPHSYSSFKSWLTYHFQLNFYQTVNLGKVSSLYTLISWCFSSVALITVVINYLHNHLFNLSSLDCKLLTGRVVYLLLAIMSPVPSIESGI